MIRFRTMLVGLGAATMLATGLLAVNANAAVTQPIVPAALTSDTKAVGCHGSGCDGKDPNVQGCSDDARNLDSDYLDMLYVAVAQLRYSPACNAAWIRIYGSPAGTGCVYPGKAVVQRGVYRPGPDAIVVEQTRTAILGHHAACNDGTVWSTMVSARDAAVRMRIFWNGHHWNTYPWH